DGAIVPEAHRAQTCDSAGRQRVAVHILGARLFRAGDEDELHKPAQREESVAQHGEAPWSNGDGPILTGGREKRYWKSWTILGVSRSRLLPGGSSTAPASGWHQTR